MSGDGLCNNNREERIVVQREAQGSDAAAYERALDAQDVVVRQRHRKEEGRKEGKRRGEEGKRRGEEGKKKQKEKKVSEKSDI